MGASNKPGQPGQPRLQHSAGRPIHPPTHPPTHDTLPVSTLCCVQLTSLTRLELQYNGFASGPPPLVGELPSLLELNLSGNLWGSACSDLPPEYAQLT